MCTDGGIKESSFISLICYPLNLNTFNPTRKAPGKAKDEFGEALWRKLVEKKVLKIEEKKQPVVFKVRAERQNELKDLSSEI